MQSIESNALEPTKAEMKGLTLGARLGRLVPVYGLVVLTVGLILLFSVLLPDTFPTMLNLRSILADKAIIGICLVKSFAFNLRVASQPSIFGRIKSMIIRSGNSLSALATPATPSSATVIV